MAEIRFQVDDAFLKQLQDASGVTKTTDIARDAFTLLNWAVQQSKNGLDIGASHNGKVEQTVAMATLQKVRAAR